MLKPDGFASAHQAVYGFPQAVAESIEDAIFRGELSPGEHLAQDKLAAAFGVSRIPMRDALNILLANGMVTLDYRRRAVVRVVTKELLQETYGIRLVLEPYACQMAIEQMTEIEKAQVLQLCGEMEFSSKDPVRGRETRRNFYENFYSTTRSTILVEMILKLRKMVEPHHRIRNSSPNSHGILQDLIASGDSQGAARWMTGHLQIALQSQLKALALATS